MAKKAATFFLRPPSWAARDRLGAYRSHAKVQPKWSGDYVVFEDAKPGEELTIVYPLPRFRQTVIVGGAEYTYEWLGNTVIGVDPPGKALPLFRQRRD